VNYQFPYITHLDQIRAAIAGADEFIVAERDWGYVVNYMVNMKDTFPPVETVNDAIRREARGLIFDLEGNLISRPYHKFFNVNERDETQAHLIDLSQPHRILEKLDGSMIRPLPIGDAYRLGTKMGITDVAMQAEVWLADYDNYHDFIMLHLERGQTPIFEWCSRQQRIVVDYPSDRLVLTAIRDVNTGAYKSYDQMRTYAEAYGVDIVREYAGTVANMEALLSETHDLTGQEGWIIRFDDGHMLKLKGSEYVMQHRAKDSIMRENGVIEMLLADKLDDVKAVLDSDTRHSLEKFEAAFWQGVATSAEMWQTVNTVVRARHGADRKAFALAPTTAVMDGNLKSAIFKSWDAPDFDWRQAVLDVVAKNIGTSTRVEAVRGLWGSARWMYGSSASDE
jgi:RNA ligase